MTCDCDIVKDLLPLYIDGCCSAGSIKFVEDHTKECAECRSVLEDMQASTELVAIPEAPKVFTRLRDWKASVLQSVLLFVLFTVIAVGVSLEARTPFGEGNGFWMLNLVVPSTGFMLSLANWYFVRSYKNRKNFSRCSFFATLAVSLGAYMWSGLHYELKLWDIFSVNTFADALAVLQSLLLNNGIGLTLTVGFCVLSKILSNQYAKMLGKE